MMTLSKRRLFACVLALSAMLAVVGLYVVLWLWYPIGTWRASGLSRVGATVLMVHLATTCLYVLIYINRRKSREEFSDDVCLVLLVQLTMGLYGLSVVAEGRPVALVFSVDRVVMVTANSVRATESSTVLSPQRLRWSSSLPLLGSRVSSDAERLGAIQLAMNGFDLAQRPSYWVPMAEQERLFKARLRPVQELHEASTSGRLGEMLPGFPTEPHWFIALESRSGSWWLVVDSHLHVKQLVRANE